MKKFEEMKYRRPSLEKIKKDLLQIIENFKQRFELPWVINGTEIQLTATVTIL